MSWNDGISAELSEYLENVGQGINRCRKVAEEVIDSEVEQFCDRVSSKIPVDTGGLAKSFTKTKDSSNPSWYGYVVEFKGNAPNGEPYQKIANILNYGSYTRSGLFFIDNATRRLKGMTDRINARIDAELSKATEEE